MQTGPVVPALPGETFASQAEVEVREFGRAGANWLGRGGAEVAIGIAITNRDRRELTLDLLGAFLRSGEAAAGAARATAAGEGSLPTWVRAGEGRPRHVIIGGGATRHVWIAFGDGRPDRDSLELVIPSPEPARGPLRVRLAPVAPPPSWRPRPARTMLFFATNLRHFSGDGNTTLYSWPASLGVSQDIGAWRASLLLEPMQLVHERPSGLVRAFCRGLTADVAWQPMPHILSFFLAGHVFHGPFGDHAAAAGARLALGSSAGIALRPTRLWAYAPALRFSYTRFLTEASRPNGLSLGFEIPVLW
jgi:hypothetical protein